MSLASSPIGKLPIAANEPAPTGPKPRLRTTTVKADIVSDPEAR